MEEDVKGKCKTMANGMKVCYVNTPDGRQAVVEVPKDGSRRIIDSGGIDREDIERGVNRALRGETPIKYSFDIPYDENNEGDGWN
jgi:hypothetical protein